MKKELLSKPAFKLIGLSVVTNNAAEQNPLTAKIAQLVEQYFSNNIPEKISCCTNPSVTFSAYTNYENDHFGNYTYFIGTEVSSFESAPPGLQSITFPDSQYQRFTTPSGKMPDVVIHAWQTIWRMSEQELGGQRSYLADFEVYDRRANDPSHTVVDIYIGIK